VVVKLLGKHQTFEKDIRFMMIHHMSSSLFRRRALVHKPVRIIFSQQSFFCDSSNDSGSQVKPSNAPLGPSQMISNKLQLYAGLSKFRLSALVVVTSGAGYMAAGVPFDAGGLLELS
jgi:hypothetical protein